MGVTLQPGDPEQVGMSVQQTKHAIELSESWVEKGIHDSLVILVARKGVVVIHEAIGQQTPEPNSTPLKRKALFPLASISKAITATAVMILVQDGLLSPERPVSEYIPEFAGKDKEKVMVHHLLTHTSGLRDEFEFNIDVYGYALKLMDELGDRWRSSVEIPPLDDNQHPMLNEYLSIRYKQPLQMIPGKEMSYCSYGYELLGEIVRRVSGKCLDDFARERIFELLGMTDTHYILPSSKRHRLVGRPEWCKKVSSPELLELPSAEGGAYSTAMDMAIFGQMFLNGGVYGDTRILSPASVVKMTTNQIPGISANWFGKFFPEASWGFGWNIHGNKRDEGILNSPEAFSHGGWGGVLLWVDPTYEIVGVYFSVELERRKNCADLFVNAVTAAVIDV